MTNNIDKQSFAQAGAVVLAATESASGDFCAVQVITDDTELTLTWPECPNVATLSDYALPAGLVIYGQIKAVTVDAGAAIAYRAVI